MCGIGGFWRSSSSEDRQQKSLQLAKDLGLTISADSAATVADELAKVVGNSLAHRGPDGAGVLHRQQMTLVHRRLSIIDLAGGAQPMSHPNGMFHVVFNGEIYNFKQLRSQLTSLGAKFQTTSDTEVLLFGYEHWGLEGLCGRLNGMFAFAIWDESLQELMVARDPFGKKPFYYLLNDDGIAFASELRALLPFASERRVNRWAMERYFWTEGVHDPATMILGIEKLTQGSWGRWRPGGKALKVARFWDPLAIELQGIQQGEITAEEAVTAFRQSFADAVERRLVSDVPLGVFLSGGVDSTLVTQEVTRILGAGKLHSFSIGFEHASYDESSFARQASDVLGTIHHHEIIKDQTFLDSIPAILDHMDEPIGDYSFLPTYQLAKMTKQHVSVALGGDGGDDVFVGYPTFAALDWSQLARWSQPLWSLTSPVHRLMTQGQGYYPLARKIWLFFEGLAMPSHLRVQEWMAPLKSREWSKAFVNPEPTTPWNAMDQEMADAVNAGLPLWRLLRAWYLRYYNISSILTKVDRATMAHGLEARAPLLDRELYQTVVRFPKKVLLSGGVSKKILKDNLRQKFDSRFVDRAKHGFAPPTDVWMRGPLRSTVESLLPDADGIWQASFLQEAWREFLAGDARHGKLFWTLLVFFWWRKKWAVSL